MADRDEDSVLMDCQKNIMDWSSEGIVENVMKCIRAGEDVNIKDGDVMMTMVSPYCCLIGNDIITLGV